MESFEPNLCSIQMVFASKEQVVFIIELPKELHVLLSAYNIPLARYLQLKVTQSYN